VGKASVIWAKGKAQKVILKKYRKVTFQKPFSGKMNNINNLRYSM